MFTVLARENTVFKKVYLNKTFISKGKGLSYSHAVVQNRQTNAKVRDI